MPKHQLYVVVCKCWSENQLIAALVAKVAGWLGILIAEFVIGINALMMRQFKQNKYPKNQYTLPRVLTISI